MDPTDFLRAVVPWTEGFTTIHWQSEKGSPFYGKSFKDVEAAIQHVASLQDTRFNIYFCLSRQRYGNGKRKREYADTIRSLWFDLDIGPDDPGKYSRIAEAMAAVFRFCMELGLPKPSFIVLSGGGVHVYWLSDRILTIAEWQGFADLLKEAARVWGLKADLGLTGDCVRVLRMPGTSNHKYDPPRPVRLLDKYSTLKDYDFAKIFAALGTPSLCKVDLASQLGPLPEAFKNLPLKSLAGGIEDILVPLAPIMAGCGWLREAYETGGKNFDQPQWNLTTYCATFMEDGHEIAHQLADQYPGYSFGQTEELWVRKLRERRNSKLGWPSCRTVQDHRVGHCASCPHFALGKSPLNLGLGVEHAEDQEEQKRSPEEDNEEIKNLGGTRPEALRLPEKFAVNQEGQICAYLASDVTGNSKKDKPPRLLWLIRNRIKDPVLQHQGGLFGLAFTSSTDRGNWQGVFVASSNISGMSLFTALRAKCVLFNPEAEAMKKLEMLATCWLDKLQQEDIATRDTGTMGWRYADGRKIGFVHGNTLYHEDGSKQPLVSAADDEFRSWYLPVGNREVWLKACKLLTDRKRPELDILIAVGFAAPLTAFSGTLYGATLSVWGDPGTSKSTAQTVAAAVFGHPKQTREALNSTAKSVQKRLGLTKNLAAYWDDIQDERHQENLFSTMFVAAGGTEGGRLNADSTMRNRLDWQTLLVACSNASFVEYLAKKQRSTTAGMRRVFEIEFNKRNDELGMIDALDAGKTFAALEHNYGVIGAEYAALLAREHQAIDKLVATITKRFTAAVKGIGDESFWWGLCGVLLAGATLACRLGAELNVTAMEAFLVQAFQRNRTQRQEEGTEGGSRANTELGLVGFLNEYLNGNLMTVDYMYEHHTVKMNIWRTPESRCPIFIQIACKENRIFISRKAMKDYLERREIHTRQVFDGLVNFFGAVEVKVTLGAGTTYAQGQERCLEIPVPRDKPGVLQGMLSARSDVTHFKVA